MPEGLAAHINSGCYMCSARWNAAITGFMWLALCMQVRLSAAVCLHASLDNSITSKTQLALWESASVGLP